MSGGKLVGIVVFVLLVGVGVYMKFSNRTDASNDVREAVMSWIVELDCYAKDREAFDSMCDLAHEHAFSTAYNLGGRRSSASFDDEKYIAEFFGFLIKQVEMRNKKDAIQELRQCQIDCEQALRSAE